MAYSNVGKGTLGRNKYKEEGDNKPEFTGKVEINGAEYRLSAWVKEANGSKFFSLSVSQSDDAPKAAPQADPDDPLPF